MDKYAKINSSSPKIKKNRKYVRDLKLKRAKSLEQTVEEEENNGGVINVLNDNPEENTVFKTKLTTVRSKNEKNAKKALKIPLSLLGGGVDEEMVARMKLVFLWKEM